MSEIEEHIREMNEGAYEDAHHALLSRAEWIGWTDGEASDQLYELAEMFTEVRRD